MNYVYAMAVIEAIYYCVWAYLLKKPWIRDWSNLTTWFYKRTAVILLVVLIIIFNIMAW